MTERTNLSVFPGGATGSDTIPRPDPTRYRRYDWLYENGPDLYAKLRWGKDLPRTVGRDVYGRELDDAARLGKNIQSFRNPVNRVVEFYASTMLMGTPRQALPLREVSDEVREAIWLIWDWSNLAAQLKILKRYVARHGISFIKVAAPKDLAIVHKQVIRAEHVTDYHKDERGHIDYIRLDIPLERGVEEQDAPKRTHTEIWRKGKRGKEGYYRVWVRDRDASEQQVVAERALGTPETNLKLSESLGRGSLRFDFVPFVDVSARDTGEKWPRPVFDHAIGLIEQANKMATRYTQLLFLYNKPHRAITGIGNDPSGRPYAPPDVTGAAQQRTIQTPDSVPFAGELARLLDQAKPDETLGGDVWYGAPGNADIRDITPNVDFEAQRRALLDITNELKRELPELLYYETLDKAELSGRALRLIMSGAVDRTIEMRANIQSAIIKTNKMALTMAQVKGLKGFEKQKIGTFGASGEAFKHNFEQGDIIAISDLENEELRGRRIANAIALMQMGLSPQQALQEVGMTHLNFEGMQGVMQDPSGMTPGTGGNPGGGTNLAGVGGQIANTGGSGRSNLEQAYRQIAGTLRGSDAIFPPAR